MSSPPPSVPPPVKSDHCLDRSVSCTLWGASGTWWRLGSRPSDVSGWHSCTPGKTTHISYGSVTMDRIPHSPVILACLCYWILNNPSKVLAAAVWVLLVCGAFSLLRVRRLVLNTVMAPLSLQAFLSFSWWLLLRAFEFVIWMTHRIPISFDMLKTKPEASPLAVDAEEMLEVYDTVLPLVSFKRSTYSIMTSRATSVPPTFPY